MIEPQPQSLTSPELSSDSEALLLSPAVQKWVLELTSDPGLSSIQELMNNQQWSQDQRHLALKLAQLLIVFPIDKAQENWWQQAEAGEVEAMLRPKATKIYRTLVDLFALSESQSIETLDLTLVTSRAA